MSDIVYSLIDKGFDFSSSHFARAKLYVSVIDKMGGLNDMNKNSLKNIYQSFPTCQKEKDN